MNLQHDEARRVEKISRLDEILGELNAYRLGWIAYDREHVRELQRERLQILDALPRVHG